MKNLLITSLLLLALILFCNQGAAIAQQQETPSIVLSANSTEDGLLLNWYLTNAEAWQEQLSIGYTLTRSEMGLAGKFGPEQTVISRATPKDNNWFNQNADLVDGLMQPIGALLYDDNFDFPETDGFDANEMKYNFLVYESTIHPEIAAAIGLGYSDLQVQAEKTYRYTLVANGAGDQASVIIKHDGGQVQDPTDYNQEFQFPQGRSLTDMYLATQPIKPKAVVAISRAYGDSIVLRWGPTTYDLWLSAMKDGYDIYKSLGIGNSELVATVLPWNKERMTESLLGQDSLAFVAASMVIAEGIPAKTEDMDFTEKAAIAETYHGMALYVAEGSPLAAEVLGFRFVDKDVQAGKGYAYEIRTKAITNPIFNGDVILENTYEPIPAPSGFWASPKEKAVTLNWDIEANSAFSSFIIERSEDGVSYTSITTKPLVFLEVDNFERKTYNYTDSVGANFMTFYYRLKGSNSFGEWSEVAETQGAAVDLKAPYPVYINKGEYLDSINSVVISWDSIQQPGDHLGYQVLLAEDNKGQYSVVSDILPPDQNEFTLDLTGREPDLEHFFIVASLDTLYNTSVSIEKYVTVPDYENPEPPIWVDARVDTSGRIEIIWDDSPSKDVTGYWIYWANSPDHEFSAVNADKVDDNFYFWDINPKSLTKYIYVCVSAEDDNYNKSATSEIIQVRRPDFIPPAQPFVESVYPNDLQLVISWVLSPSTDVEGQVIYKRLSSESDTAWVALDTLSSDVEFYLDNDLQIGEEYNYCLKAFDAAANICDYSNFKKGILPFPADLAVATDITVVIDEKSDSHLLSWTYNPGFAQLKESPYVIDIYRSKGSKPLKLYSNNNRWCSLRL